MGDECKSCRKWEEDMYWSHFQTVQFFQVLSGRFDQQLAIPPKFANNLREKLAGSVHLKGPSGATWSVELTANGDKLFLKHGWKEFVDAHFLEENDLLIFKYNGDSRFDVSMFDRQSSCEKESSYFVRKCAHTEAVSGGGKRKRSIPERYDAAESSHEVFEDTPIKKPRKVRACTSTSGARAIGMLRATEAKSTISKSTAAYQLQLKSNRRAITEEEKKKAVDMATAALTENSFLVVMRLSHVYRGFYMSIPVEWARIHLPRRSLDVMLRVNENTWHVRFDTQSLRTGLTGGWKTFVLENFLEEFDVCVFNLTSGEDEAPILDVSIFRVVEEVIPPSRVRPKASTRGRKPNKLVRKNATLATA